MKLNTKTFPEIERRDTHAILRAGMTLRGRSCTFSSISCRIAKIKGDEMFYTRTYVLLLGEKTKG